ncbi:MAG: hypothetical protein IJI57_15725 [Flexilinea sp.]|nr:hypothetical protein [Flexilinea sp.]
MGSKKLVLCCIAGIVLGYLAPLALSVNRSTALSIGMVAGLAIGYLLDIMDEKRSQDSGNVVIAQKADSANKLLEQARAEVSGKPYDKSKTASEEDTVAREQSGTDELTPEEQNEKLNEAEDLLRKARERIGK